MKCITESGRHKWRYRFGPGEMSSREATRIVNDLFKRDASLRICAHCGARAHIDGQGATVIDAVQIPPVTGG